VVVVGHQVVEFCRPVGNAVFEEQLLEKKEVLVLECHQRAKVILQYISLVTLYILQEITHLQDRGFPRISGP